MLVSRAGAGPCRYRERDAMKRQRWIARKPVPLSRFGLRVSICPKCGSFNPSGLNEPIPTKCYDCGADLPAERQQASSEKDKK
jgi:hypothetical protein